MTHQREKKLRRARRTRLRIARKAGGRLRLSVARSHKNISAQIIDDVSGRTLASASTLESGEGADGGSETDSGSKTQSARRIGTLIAERGKEAGVSKVVFDRGGFVYHGRVRALAEAAREAGLDF